MIRLLVFLVVATALALVAVWFAENPGHVAVEWRGYRVETTVGIMVLAALAVALAVTLLIEVARWLLALPRRLRTSSRQRRELRGYRELASGMIAAAAGDTKRAQLHTRHADKLLPHAGAVLLLEAQTAQLVGDDDAAQLRFRQMLRNPETEFLGLRGLLAQAVKAGDQAEALELARRAYRRNNEAPWAASTLFDLLTRHERWAEALEIVDQLRHLGVVDQAEAARHKAALQYLVARQLLQDGRLPEAHKMALKAFRTQPAFTPAAVLAAETAQRLDRARKARRVLELAWEVAPHPDLARAYADLVPNEQPNERLARFERLRARNPGHPETLATLAELAIAARQLDTARSLLTRAREGELTARVCRLSAELERVAGDHAREQEWSSRVERAKPDPAWVCEDTGEVLPAWAPFGRGARFNRVFWTTPPKVAALTAADRPMIVIAHESAPGQPSAPEPRPTPEARSAPEPRPAVATPPEPRPVVAAQPEPRPAAGKAAAPAEEAAPIA